MPDTFRIPTRMDCLGLDLVSPLDRMEPGAFPFLVNCRVIVEGRIDSRPGYTLYSGPLPIHLLHSIRRLNDTTRIYAAGGYTYIVGNGITLLAGVESALIQIDTNYSGDPLSLLTFRPENSPVAWMYVYDRIKQSKVRPDGAVRDIGAAPPGPIITAEYGHPSKTVVSEGYDTSGWVAYDQASSPSEVSRINTSIASIFYFSGNTGNCLVSPVSSPASAGPRMRVKFNSGGGNEEILMIREIHPAFPATQILGITYDSGTTGMCTIVLDSMVTKIDRNSLVQVGEVLATADTTRVTSVSKSSDLATLSFRCTCAHTHHIGDLVTGFNSWYTFTSSTHAAGESLTAGSVQVTGSGAGAGALALLTSIDCSTTPDKRQIDPANDWMHISLKISDPKVITAIILQVDIASGTTTVGSSGNAFTADYYQWVVDITSINQGQNSWTEILVPISAGDRIGNDLSRTLANVKAVQILITATGDCSFGFSSWYFFGTFGPTIQPNSPTGYLYQSVNRDATTGDVSVPGPPTRFQMFPLREDVLVTPMSTSASGIDSLDVYRQGGTLANFSYIGTVANNPVTPVGFLDVASDATIQAAPNPDLSTLQPWPILGVAWTGVVSVVGAAVTWVSGRQFDRNLVAATVISINGIDYQTYGQPVSATLLFITTSVTGGVVTNATYTISNPILAGQPLPFAFGPLEGPFAPVIFGLGDPLNAGTLYYTNSSNADGASDQNTLELCPPGEPLISGAVWNGLVVCGSRDNLYLVRYSYLTTLGESSNTTYQFSRIPSSTGIWSRWACVRGPDGIYFLGKDGIYRVNDQSAVNISDRHLYPLFPHDGQAAKGANGFLPVDMARLQDLRMSAGDSDIYFDYFDAAGAGRTLRYEIAKQRWFWHAYADPPSTHYLVEPLTDSPNIMDIVLLSKTSGKLYLAGGNTDNGIAISSFLTTPSVDTGDERLQKLYVDVMTDADGAGPLTSQITFNNQTVVGPTVNFILTGPRGQNIQNISSLANLGLYRNVSASYSWSGGPDGPHIYSFEPSGFVQPYLSTFLVTQYLNLSFPGWKHHRRLYAGLISNSEVLFTISTQDGRSFGPYTIPSSGGRFRIFPIMLDQTIKDLAFAYQLDGQGTPFAFFAESFTIETKEWNQGQYADVSIWKT